MATKASTKKSNTEKIPRGEPVARKKVKEVKVRKSRLAAGLMGIFLGAFGIHNFYLGFNNRGLTQIIISIVGGALTCGVAYWAVQVWGLIEGILILIRHDGYTKDADGLELSD